MNSFQAGIVISLACYLAIGWYAGKRVKHLEDFFVAGRNAPTVLILGTLVASFMSTNAFMGEAGMSYQGHAPLVIIMTCFNCLGYIVGMNVSALETHQPSTLLASSDDGFKNELLNGLHIRRPRISRRRGIQMRFFGKAFCTVYRHANV